MAGEAPTAAPASWWEVPDDEPDLGDPSDNAPRRENLTIGGAPSTDVVPGLADLLNDIHDLYTRYIAFIDPSHPTALALWTMYTHCFGQNQPYSVVPYVLITSAEPMSGKSTILELAAKLVRNPMPAVGSPVDPGVGQR